MPTNACIVTPYYRSLTKDQGGVGTHYADLVESLASLLGQLHLIYVAEENLDQETIDALPSNVHYHFLFDGWFSHPALSGLQKLIMGNAIGKRLVRILQNIRVWLLITYLHLRFRIDVVETTNYSYLCLIYALLGHQSPLITRVSSLRDQVVSHGNYKSSSLNLVERLEDFMIKLSDVKLSHTVRHSQHLASIFNIPFNKIHLIPHATRLHTPSTETTWDDNLTVFFVGRLEYRKGIDLLLDVIPEVIQRVPQARFRIAGKDSENNWSGSFIENHPELSSKVVFLGPISNQQLDQEYKNCSLLAAPSTYESFGLIYIEAMAHGKPVIGTNAGGIPEVVHHQVNGLLIEPGDREALLDSLIELLNNDSLRFQMGRAGYETVQHRFSLEALARQSRDLYTSCSMT